MLSHHQWSNTFIVLATIACVAPYVPECTAFHLCYVWYYINCLEDITIHSISVDSDDVLSHFVL